MQEVTYKVPSPESAPECVKIHSKLIEVIGSLKPRRVLDIGCGSGDLTAELFRVGLDVVGLEPTELAGVAEKRCGVGRIIRGSCYDVYDENRFGKFDVVIASEVIEHLYLPRKLAEFSAAALSNNGHLVLSLPHYGSYWRNLFIALTNRWDYHHTPLWDGGHIKFFPKIPLEFFSMKPASM